MGGASVPVGEQLQGSVIQEFYRGTSVFITGGSGFMGKVLVEKLLRSCPHITRIFLLLRPKRGKGSQERVNDLLQSPCFQILLQENPKIVSKLVAISGDIGEVGLGLSEADRRLLREHVDVVFHMAATVRFDEPLRVAILQNVRGTREVLTLCRTFTKIKSVIHVSTAYCQCPLAYIDEVLYDAPIDCEKAIAMVENSDDETLSQQQLRLLGKWPNTYSFSKAISEQVVKFYGQGLPIGIVRPSIVIACVREPMPGWCDTPYGPMGLSMAMATGIARTINVDGKIVPNLIPCDLANNCIIAAAWDVCTKSLSVQSNSPDPFIYNFASPSEEFGDSWQVALNHLKEDVKDFPPTQSLWYLDCNFTTNRLLTVALRLLFHYLPALIVDLISYANSKETRMVKIYKKLHTHCDAFTYFTSRNWGFGVHHVDELWNKLDATDQKLFPFELRTLNWRNYYRTYWFGVRTYLLKDTIETIPKAKSRLRKLYLIHRTVQCVCVGVLVWLLWSVLEMLWSMY